MPLASASRRPRGQTSEAGHIPAPTGGINTVDGGSVMPPLDAVYVWNMLAAEYGLRVRPGYREWCTLLTGNGNDEVRSVFCFTGSTASKNRVFATTSTGIWDVSASSSSVTQVATFTIGQGSEAGYGVSTVLTTLAGRFLLYADEENGVLIYSEATDDWVQPTLPDDPWQPNTDYYAGNQVSNGGNIYACTDAGTSAASGGPTGTGSGIADGSAVWEWVSAVAATSIYPSAADVALGYAGDPTTFAFVTVFKNRVWFVERGSARGWYLDVDSIYGEATSFNFGAKMRTGGPLRGLWNWSYDGGNGLDTLLVGVSGGGDVVIYAGTDPASATTFAIKGCWSVGAVPYGRRIATESGGDLMILSTLGVVQTSRLVLGDINPDATYSTRKIGNLFNQLATQRAEWLGWAILTHPEENALMVLIPEKSGTTPTQQLVMAYGSKGWSRYRGLPILSAGVSDQVLYFGTDDGRVCQNTGDLDDITLAAPTEGDPIAWSVMTAYRNLGNMRQKQVKMIRPVLIGSTAYPTIQVTAKYNYDLNEPDAPSAAASSAGFDVDAWDTAIWDAAPTATAPLQGATGMGRDVAIAVRGQDSTRTTLVGIDVSFEQGGIL